MGANPYTALSSCYKTVDDNGRIVDNIIWMINLGKNILSLVLMIYDGFLVFCVGIILPA
jgi:hypothetical protein